MLRQAGEDLVNLLCRCIRWDVYLDVEVHIRAGSRLSLSAVRRRLVSLRRFSVSAP